MLFRLEFGVASFLEGAGRVRIKRDRDKPGGAEGCRDRIWNRYDQFGFTWMRTCTLTEAHSRPGLVKVEASRLGGRSALTASSSCSRGSSAFRNWKWGIG